MPGIVCAVRGGPSSRLTIAKAIELAREVNLPLYFLYVVNLDFLSYTSSSRTKAITEEMYQLGEFILLAAQAEASRHGITAHNEIREGKVAEEIVKFSAEVEADKIVLGLPGQTEGKESVFDDPQLASFIHRIEEETGIEVVLVGENAQE